jgi:uncharacterized damage-inducible protein DinB
MHAEQLLAEYRAEAQTTRKFLSRLPEDKLTWKPHEKSMTAGQLAYHIAAAPAGIVQMALKNEFAVSDIPQTQEQPTSVRQVLDAFEQSVAAVEEHLPKISDDEMQQPWRLLDGDKELLNMPRAVMLRTVLFNHIYHHRGQFGVYLRLVGAKVPSAYGPSGDEMPDFLAK